LGHNSAIKDDLKSSPIDVLWVVFSRNGTGNNGKNRIVGKIAHVFHYWGGGLKFERGDCGEDFRFVLGVLEFRGRGLSWGEGLGSRVEDFGFEFGKI